MSTISNKTITQTVTLGSVNNYPTYASPLTIAATGAVEVAAAAAIYGPGTQAWTVVNDGMVINNSTTGYGIALDQGGAVTNNAGGTITAYDSVIISGAAASVMNAGYIKGNIAGVKLVAGGIVTNVGTIVGTNGNG